MAVNRVVPLNIEHTKDPRFVGVVDGTAAAAYKYLEDDWVQCEVPKKLLRGYEQATTGGLYSDRRVTPSVEPSYEVMKWLNKNCTGEWRWFYRVLGGYDRITFLGFEKEQDLFYYRLRF
jgi:hypothetical protein